MPGSDAGPDLSAVQIFDTSTVGLGLTRTETDGFAGGTAGNFNGDAFDDLAIAIPHLHGLTGTIVVLYGSPTGLTTTGAQLRWGRAADSRRFRTWRALAARWRSRASTATVTTI